MCPDPLGAIYLPRASFTHSCTHVPDSNFYSLLLIEFVASTASENDVKNAIARKDKKKMPVPVSALGVAACGVVVAKDAH